MPECEKVFEWINDSERLHKLMHEQVTKMIESTKPLLPITKKSTEEEFQKVFNEVHSEVYSRVMTNSAMFLILGAISSMVANLDKINLGGELETKPSSSLEEEIDEINAITNLIVKLPIAKLRLLKESLKCEVEERKDKEEKD